MLKKEIGKNKFLYRLEHGEEAMTMLTKIGEEHNSLCKLSAIGACTDLELGFLNGTEYEWKEFNDEYEIISFEGSISFTGEEVTPHVHVTIADRDFNVFGGHLKKLIAYPMIELFVEVFDEKVQREYDKDSKMKLMKF
ncbi:DNA-binding protein [Mycoplasmatota bacterium zrk1]